MDKHWKRLNVQQGNGRWNIATSRKHLQFIRFLFMAWVSSRTSTHSFWRIDIEDIFAATCFLSRQTQTFLLTCKNFDYPSVHLTAAAPLTYSLYISNRVYQSLWLSPWLRFSLSWWTVSLRPKFTSSRPSVRWPPKFLFICFNSCFPNVVQRVVALVFSNFDFTVGCHKTVSALGPGKIIYCPLYYVDAWANRAGTHCVTI